MRKWSVKVQGHNQRVEVEATDIADSEAWVDFVRHEQPGGPVIVRRWRRDHVLDVMLVED